MLPPQLPQHKGKHTLVLDIDETLVHSGFDSIPSPDISFPVYSYLDLLRWATAHYILRQKARTWPIS